MMTQDPALTLKQAVEKGEPISEKQAQALLAQSDLVARLLTDPKQKPRTFVGLRAHEWRLLELCEIPFTHTLVKVRQWLDLLLNRTATPEGFSLTGRPDGYWQADTTFMKTAWVAFDKPKTPGARISYVIGSLLAQ